MLLIALCAVLAFNPNFCVHAQPEPLSPDEEWYPPPPGEYWALSYDMFIVGYSTPPSPGAISIILLDVNSKVRNEFYGSEPFYMSFISPFDKFVIYLYEWYPPGTIPTGHWLMWSEGPVQVFAGAIINIGYFYPEINEPEGLHVWKCWLYDPSSGEWATGIVRFNYYKHPKAIIESVDYPQDIIVGERYEINAYIKNLGEIDYRYTIIAKGLDILSPKYLTLEVKAKSISNAMFSFNVTSAGTRNLTIELYADNALLDSETLTLSPRILKPGPIVAGDFNPTVLREGEETTLSFTFINTGEGDARQVTARLDAPSFIVISGVDSSPNVEHGGTGRVVFTLKPTEGGRKTISVKVTYSDIVANTYSDQISTTVLVQVKVEISSQDIKGRSLEVPIKINGIITKTFNEWIDPTIDTILEAPIEFVNPNMNSTKWIFKQWSDGYPVNSRTVNPTKSSTILAIYTPKHYVSVSSPLGKTSGEGWYAEGDTAEISIEQTALGFGIKRVFDHWEDNNGKVISTKNRFSMPINEPASLKAVWRTEYYELIAIIAVPTMAIIITYSVYFYKKTRNNKRKTLGTQLPETAAIRKQERINQITAYPKVTEKNIMLKTSKIKPLPTEDIDSRVFQYICAHQGTISISQAINDLKISEEEFLASIQRLKEKKMIE